MLSEVTTVSGEKLCIGAAGVVKQQDTSFQEVDLKQVKQCLLWLDRAQATGEPTVSSFWLQHVVQQWAGMSISNGAVIVAAHRLGFAIGREPGDVSANVSIGVATHCIDEFDCGCGHP